MFRRPLLAIFFLALVVRLALVLPMPADSVRTPLSSDFTMDARAYADIAKNLLEHGVFGYGERASAFRPPLYPAALAASFAVTGEDYRVVRVGQALLGAWSCVALGLLGTLLLGARTGRLAALAMTFYPFTLYFTGELMTETAFIALTLTAWWLVVRAWLAPTRAAGLLAGLTLGAAILCRPTALAFGALTGAVGLWVLWRRPAARPRGKALVIAGLTAAVVFAPWVLRNSLLFGEPVGLTTYTGLNLYKGLPGKNDVSSMADFGVAQQTIEDPAVVSLPVSEPELDRAMRAYWRQFISVRPAAYLREKLADLNRFWFDFRLAGNVAQLDNVLAIGAMGVYVLVLMLAVIGAARAWRDGRRSALVIPLVVIFGTMLLHVPFFAGKRFRIATVDPLLLLLAADACRIWWERRRAARG